jgi:hypothetical protein
MSRKTFPFRIGGISLNAKATVIFPRVKEPRQPGRECCDETFRQGPGISLFDMVISARHRWIFHGDFGEKWILAWLIKQKMGILPDNTREQLRQ